MVNFFLTETFYDDDALMQFRVFFLVLAIRKIHVALFIVGNGVTNNCKR